MQEEILSLNGNSFTIWYTSPIYRTNAIEEVYNQLYIKKLQTNAVQNPGFEIASTQYMPASWWNGINSGAATFLYDSVAKTPTGRSGMGAGITLSTSGDAYWAQTISGITPSTMYPLTGYANTQGVTGFGAYLEVDWFDSSMNYISGSASTSTPIMGTTSWTQLQVNSTSPANAAKANIILRLMGSGTVIFDDISFEGAGGGPTPTPTPSPSPTPTPTPGPTQTPPPGGTPPPTIICPSGQINLIGTCVPKNYLLYGGIGLVLLMVLKK